MSLPEQLRLAAEAEGRTDTPPGSTYLYALGAAYLGCPENSDHEARLEMLFAGQASTEDVDGDEVLNTLAMVDPLCGQAGGVVGPEGHTQGVCALPARHDGQHDWEPSDAEVDRG